MTEAAPDPAGPVADAGPGEGTQRARVCWVVLTMGDRPRELAAALGSIPGRGRADVEVVVVANGGTRPDVPTGVRVVETPVNLGIPGGRNAGAAAGAGTVLVFLDDDAAVAEPAAVAAAIERFDREPDLAVVAMRIVDPVEGGTARRHVPRLRAGDPTRSGDVTSFLGGACAIRRSAFEAVGGYPETFFYALEETDLAWRLIDAGWRVYYDATAVVHHPRTDIARHGDAHRRTARNRVLLARRLLPALLAPVYVSTWGAITLVRGRSRASVNDWVQGTRDGMAMSVDRRPLSWRGVWRLTRLGRPPVV
jgi:GT2 family glycosyltransferase